MSSDNLTFESILAKFEEVMDDLEASKAFIDSNIDLVPSMLFLHLLSAEKLSAQSKNNMERMMHIHEVRNRYILAHDQLFFPLGLEVKKAETRVMTYLARSELRGYASRWDEVEMTLHFSTLLASRLVWDDKVGDVEEDIREKMDAALEYLAAAMRKDLVRRELHRPSITSEIYQNASLAIQEDMPELYAKVRPEVQALHETYFLEQQEDIVRWVGGPSPWASIAMARCPC
jgi:hypothetical protein